MDGGKIIEAAEGLPLAPSDQAMLRSCWGQAWMEANPVRFAHGLEGYADDRIADGSGWVSFDASTIRCPVIVLHGERDVIADPIHARHTTEVVAHAELRIIEDLGHFSIEDKIVPTLTDLLASPREGCTRTGLVLSRHRSLREGAHTTTVPASQMDSRAEAVATSHRRVSPIAGSATR